MGHLSALLFVIISFWIPERVSEIRDNTSAKYACWLTLLFRHGMAFINAFVAPLSTTWGDLYFFHETGAAIARGAGPPNATHYASFLGALYRVFGTSFWLGETASVVAYSLSLLVMAKLASLLKQEHRLAACILVYGLMPSPAIHCSVTFRESYQALAFLATGLALLTLRATGKNWAWPLLASSLLVLIFLHQGLALFALFVLAIGVPWALRGRGSFGLILATGFLIIFPWVAPKLVESLESESDVARAISQGNFAEYATTYRDFITKARSDYGVKIDSSDPVSLIQTSALVMLMYFVAPLPWQVSSVMDYYAFFEVVVRTALLYGTLRRALSTHGEQKQYMLVLLSMFFVLEFMWAAGTTNWGTSLRHHVVAFGVLTLLGVPYFSGVTLDPEYTHLERRRALRKKRETDSKALTSRAGVAQG